MSKTVYITVRLDIYNPDYTETSEQDLQDIIFEMDYNFSHEGFEIESEICGINENNN